MSYDRYIPSMEQESRFVEDVKELDQETRLEVLRLLLDAIFRDGVVDNSEKVAFRKISRDLGLSKELVKKEVETFRNKYGSVPDPNCSPLGPHDLDFDMNAILMPQLGPRGTNVLISRWYRFLVESGLVEQGKSE